MSATPLDTPQIKLGATAAPLAAGTYLVTAYCETRLAAPSPGVGVVAHVLLNGGEVGTDTWDLDQWHAFAAVGAVTMKAGETPMMEITFNRLGGAGTVEIRRARLAIALQRD